MPISGNEFADPSLKPPIIPPMKPPIASPILVMNATPLSIIDPTKSFPAIRFMISVAPPTANKARLRTPNTLSIPTAPLNAIPATGPI